MDCKDWIMFAATLGAGVLTAIATVLAVWFTNKKTSENYEKQLNEMQRSQEQNVNIQLFEKRHEVYSTLDTWNRITKLAFSKTIINLATGDILPPKKAFMQILFDETEFKTKEATESIINYNPTYYERTDDYIRMLNGMLQHLNTIESKDEQHTRTLEQAKNHFNNQIHRVSEPLNHTKSERFRLEFAKHIYTNIDFDKLSSFADAFSNAVSIVSDNNIKRLEETHKIFEEAKILEKMEELLKL